MALLLSFYHDCEETMAESTKEVATSRPKPKAGTGTPTTGKKRTPTKLEKGDAALDRAIQEAATSVPETAAKPRFGFFRSLGGRRDAKEAGASTSRTASSAGQPQRPANPSMGRFFFGMSLYMVLALAAQFLLSFIFQRLPASYTTQALFTLPLLGGVTTYLLVWMLTLVLILYALYKFKILPRSLARPPAQPAAKVDPKAKAAPTTKVTRAPVEGPNDDAYARVKARIRAERRKARRS
jgi:hypothetical protein